MDPYPNPIPDPLVRGTDPWIRIRTKMSRIRGTVYIIGYELPVFVMNLFLLFPAVSSGLTEDQKLIQGLALSFASICSEHVSSLSCSQFRSDRGPEADPGHGAQLCQYLLGIYFFSFLQSVLV